MSLQIIDVSNITDICRLCLSQNCILVPIYQNTSDRSNECDSSPAVSISSKISATVSLEVPQDEYFPAQVCKDCLNKIDEWYTFKLACHEAHEALKQCVQGFPGNLSNGLCKISSPIVDNNSEVTYTIVMDAEKEISELIQDESSLDGTSVKLLDCRPKEPEQKMGFGGLESSVLTPQEIKNHLTCQICGKVFSRYNNRMLHEKKYHKTKTNDSSESMKFQEEYASQFACKYCSKVFSRIDLQKTHEVRIHTKKRSFFCECGQSFVRHHDMTWHQNTHVKNLGVSTGSADDVERSSGKGTECSMCNTTFARVESLNEHIKLFHLSDKFQCDVCHDKFFSMEELKWHHEPPDGKKKIDTLDPNPPSNQSQFLCNICDHSFSDLFLCKSHILRLHSIPVSSKRLLCSQLSAPSSRQPQESNSEICVQSQAEKNNTKTFSDYETDCDNISMLNDCEDMEANCDASNINTDTMKKLFIDEHSYVSKQSYFCSYCGKEFNNVKCVNAHEKRHANERLFKCKDCGKAFQTISRLKTHSLIHANVKPFSCDVCELRFRTSSNLLTHMKRHTSNPKFLCKTCGKDFFSKSGLIRHETLHTGRKAFTCEECGKSFVTQQECTKHTKYHTGEKAHVCQYCGKSFYERGHLASHLLTHVSEKPYSCSICSLSFYSNAKLNRHKKTEAHQRRINVNLPSNKISGQGFNTDIVYDDEPGGGPSLFDDLETGDCDDQTEYGCNDESQFLKD